MIIFIVTFFAFVLEYVLNIYFSNSIFLPLIIFTSLVLVESFFKGDRCKYYIYCFLVGFLYDYVYTGNYFLNSGLFLLIGVLVCLISFYMPNNFFVFFLKMFLLIIFYRLCLYMFFCINGVIMFSFSSLFKYLYSSLILNICYGTFLYFVLCFVSKKFHIKRIN